MGASEWVEANPPPPRHVLRAKEVEKKEEEIVFESNLVSKHCSEFPRYLKVSFFATTHLRKLYHFLYGHIFVNFRTTLRRIEVHV
jgi:hypothetical protein